MTTELHDTPRHSSDTQGDEMLTHEETPILPKRPALLARLVHGTSAGAFAYGLGIVSNLLLLPLYLRHWSVAVYGEWMTLYAIVNYLGNLDFGVTMAAINAATMAYARNDWKTFKRIQGTAWATSLAIAGLGSAVVLGLSLFYFRVDQWLGLKAIDHHDSRIVFCLLAISLFAGIPGNQLIAVYTSTGQFAKYQWLYNAYAFVLCINTATALSLGARPILLAGVISGTSLCNICFSLLLLRRRGALLLPRLRDADWHTARSLAAPTGQFGIAMLASALTVQGPVVVLSRALGGPSVALFVTTRTVANVVRGTLSLLRAPLRPEFGAAAAKPGKEALQRLFRIAVGLDATIALTLTAVLWWSGVWLIRFWSHGHIRPDPMLLHLLLMVYVLEGFLQVMAIPGWATNRLKGVSFGLIASAVVGLVLSEFLVSRWGPSAIPLGMLVPMVGIIAPLALRSACRETGLPIRFIVGRLLLPFGAIAVVSALLPAWIDRISQVPTWLASTSSSIMICTLTSLTVLTVFLTRNDRQSIRSRIPSSWSPIKVRIR